MTRTPDAQAPAPSGRARLVCAQLAPKLADLDANRALTTAAIESAAERAADLVVLPELVSSGYMLDRDEAERVAITPTDPLFDAWSSAARGAVVVGGFCERGEDEMLYNSVAVVDSRGVRAVYRKTHLWGHEHTVFTAGSHPPPIITCDLGRLAPILCYDLEFPELTRSLALAGADLIAVPANWPLVPRPPDERPPEVVIAMAAARVNRLAIACCDRAGTERGQVWTQGTAIIDTDGWVVATSGDDGFAVADVDLTPARDKSLPPHNDLIKDRRPDLYGLLGPVMGR
jgi:5-aminopentanamidase